MVALITVAITCLGRNRTQTQPPAPIKPKKMKESSRLLMLPKELRTKIWEHTLPVNVDLSSDQPHAPIPSLAPACSQTFREVLSTYLGKTTFTANIVDGDGAFLLTLAHSRRRLKISCRLNPDDPDSPRQPSTRGGILRWRNLLKWAEAAHAHGKHHMCFRRVVALQRESEKEAISTVLDIAVKLRALLWQEVKEVLELLHPARDPRWV